MTIQQQNLPAPNEIRFDVLADASPKSDKSQVIAAFKEVVAPLNEKDYGDFMREVGLYLDYLDNAFSEGPDAAYRKVQEMREYTLFDNPDGVEDVVRRRLLEDADLLMALVSGQPH